MQAGQLGLHNRTDEKGPEAACLLRSSLFQRHSNAASMQHDAEGYGWPSKQKQSYADRDQATGR
jgi:hypothetical protein